MVALILVVAGAFSVPKIQRMHRHLEVINKTHFVAACMRAYVAHYGKFPESLEALAADSKLDAGAIGPLNGEHIVYKQPAREDADSVIILTVTGHGFETVVTKDFERRTVKIPRTE